jgi:hypothetical protein
MGTVAISQHEAAHVLALAAATVMICPKRYGDVDVDVQIKPQTGHVIVTIGDVEKSKDALDLSQRVAALLALGPCIEHADPAGLIRAKDYDTLTAPLSDADRELLAKTSDNSLAHAKVILAAKELQDTLGIGRWHRWCKTLRNCCNQGQSDWKLSELVPQNQAIKAVKAATEAIEDIMDPPITATAKAKMMQSGKVGSVIGKRVRGK